MSDKPNGPWHGIWDWCWDIDKVKVGDRFKRFTITGFTTSEQTGELRYEVTCFCGRKHVFSKKKITQARPACDCVREHRKKGWVYDPLYPSWYHRGFQYGDFDVWKEQYLRSK